MSTGAVAAAVARRAERKIVARLRESGATNRENPCPLGELEGIEARKLGRLLASGAIVEPRQGLYSLDEEAYASYRGRRKLSAAGILAVALAIAAAAYWLASRG